MRTHDSALRRTGDPLPFPRDGHTSPDSAGATLSVPIAPIETLGAAASHTRAGAR